MPALLVAVEADREQQDRALGDHLDVLADIQEDQAVAEDAENQDARHNVADPALAAVDADATEDDRGQNFEFKALACQGLTGVRSGEHDDAGNAGEQAGEGIDQVFDPPDVDAGQVEKLFTPADRIE